MTMLSTEFAKRRRHFLSMIGKGGMAIVPAAPARVRNRSTFFPYRQDSDFHYLTGFGEPESVAVFIPGRGHGEFILFCRDRDLVKEQWDGPRAGQEGAVEQYGADDAFPIGDIDEILPRLVEQCERLFYTVGTYPEFDRRVLGWVGALRSKRQAGHVPDQLVSLEHMVHEMRLFKSRREITAMRKAGRIAVEAHKRAMAARLRPR